MSPDERYISRAIALARDAAGHGDRPFGAVVVAADGDVLGEGRNSASSSGDITAHAELVAIRAAIDAGQGERLAGATVYASGEPCPMCAAACVWAGVGRIVFAASTAAFSVILPEGPHFGLGCADVVGASDSVIVVQGPVAEDEALRVMGGG